MLSPNRASRIVLMAARPRAARAQTPTRRATSGSATWPVTVLRATPSRVWTAANSRSPCAAWWRFMKSMSISAHGSAWFAWVCRWSRGLRSASRPEIHIFAGLKVCIQAITPTHASVTLASSRVAADRVGLGQHRLRDHADRDRGRGAEGGDDVGGVRGHLVDDLGPVEVLAPGQEPDLGLARLSGHATPPGWP